MKHEMNNDEYRNRYDSLMLSLHDQQTKLWSKVDVLNTMHLNGDKNSICGDYMYHKKLNDYISEINHLRSLELALGRLFLFDDPDIDESAIYKLVSDVAAIYCKAF